MRRKFILIMLVLLLAAGMPAASFGAQAGKSVNVKLPGFNVTINGVRIDNNYSQYPFIVYNDITYFPMTYSGCRFLGLETDWQGNKAGLSVEKTGVTAAYFPYKSTARNGSSYKASVPGFPIKVNGKAVDNGSLEYPLLSFRDITYFPMTWEFGVSEFGWDYSFSNKDGLIINSDNINLEQKTLADAIAKRGYDYAGYPGNVTVTDKYIYYEDGKGQIIQAALNDPAARKAVYQLPVWTYGNGEYVFSSLYVENGIAYLDYHQGGAVMGSDWLFRLNDDGAITELQNSYWKTNIFGDKTFTYWYGPTPGPGNLNMKIGDGEDNKLGSSDYWYGWASNPNEEITGGIGTYEMALAGTSLYILAREDGSQKGGINRIDIITGEEARVSGKAANSIVLEGDSLYYHIDGAFYRLSIQDGKEEKIRQVTEEPDRTGLQPDETPEQPVKSFLVLNGRIYWQKQSDQGLYDIDGKSLNSGAALDSMAIMGSSGEYLVATFGETDSSKYRILVFDRDGNVVFKTSDKAYCRNISIFGDRIYFYNLTTGTVCIGRLNH